MATPPMLLDIARTLLALAAPAALLCRVLAGIALRRDGGRNFSIGGGFSRWMFWAVVFLTLPQLMAWFPALVVPAALPAAALCLMGSGLLRLAEFFGFLHVGDAAGAGKRRLCLLRVSGNRELRHFRPAAPQGAMAAEMATMEGL
jgi:hypothetical protein